MSREPTAWINAVKSFLQLLVVSGFGITQAQQDATVDLVAALFALGLLGLLEAVGTALIRRRVTPTASPSLPSGTVVRTTDPTDGSPVGTTTV